MRNRITKEIPFSNMRKPDQDSDDFSNTRGPDQDHLLPPKAAARLPQRSPAHPLNDPNRPFIQDERLFPILAPTQFSVPNPKRFPSDSDQLPNYKGNSFQRRQ